MYTFIIQEMKSLVTEFKEKQANFERQLQTQYAISRRKTLEIEDLKSKLKNQEGNKTIHCKVTHPRCYNATCTVKDYFETRNIC